MMVEPAVDAQTSVLAPRRVLAADDSMIMRRLPEAKLSAWGYDIVLASDGAEAWEILSSPSPRQWPYSTGGCRR